MALPLIIGGLALAGYLTKKINDVTVNSRNVVFGADFRDIGNNAAPNVSAGNVFTTTSPNRPIYTMGNVFTMPQATSAIGLKDLIKWGIFLGFAFIGLRVFEGIKVLWGKG